SDYGGHYGSIFLHLLKAIDEQNLYNTDPDFNFAAPYNVILPLNPTLVNQKVPIYLCPSDTTASVGTAQLGTDQNSNPVTWGMCSYAANYLVFGNISRYNANNPWASFNGTSIYPESIKDGPTKTIMFTEK